MSVPSSAAIDIPSDATLPPRESGGFFAWLRRVFLGTPASGARRQATEAAPAANVAAAGNPAPVTYVIAPGGYRIRVPQPDDVHRGISQMVASVRDGLALIPPLPHVVIELLKEIQNPAATAASVGAIASADPAMAASLIRTVNSAAFALHRKITSVSEAVNYIGFASVKAMVLHLQLDQVLGKGAAHDADLQDLWVHSMMVSYIADALAKQVSGVDRGFVSTLGLLHDIGKVVVRTRFPAQAETLQAARAASAQGSPDAAGGSLAAERRVLGVDHADLGANVSAQWGLPGDLVRAIRYHHAPHKAFEATDPKPLHQAVYLVQIANQLAKYCYVYTDELEIDLVDSAALEAVGLGANLTALLEDPAVRAAASRAIFFAQETSPILSKKVRRFLQLHRGPAAAALLAAQLTIEAPAPQQLRIDDDLCDELFAQTPAADATEREGSAFHFRAAAAASEFGINTLTTDAKRHLAKLNLPNEKQLPLAMIARCLLANVPQDAKARVEIVHAADGNTVTFAIKAAGIGFTSRFGPEADFTAAARVLDSELANVLNLKWFNAITISSDGSALVFSAAR
jgi:putative nucleotidyltransferase with HDIG domain